MKGYAAKRGDRRYAVIYGGGWSGHRERTPRLARRRHES
jgi:hypothetical protein